MSSSLRATIFLPHNDLWDRRGAVVYMYSYRITKEWRNLKLTDYA